MQSTDLLSEDRSSAIGLSSTFVSCVRLASVRSKGVAAVGAHPMRFILLLLLWAGRERKKLLKFSPHAGQGCGDDGVERGAPAPGGAVPTLLLCRRVACFLFFWMSTAEEIPYYHPPARWENGCTRDQHLWNSL
eukprot:scaffold78903_cov43-Tisochrysis_lutea.AAC.3